MNLIPPCLWLTSVAEVCSAQFTELTLMCWALEAKGEDRVPSENSVREPRLSTEQTGSELQYSKQVLGWAPAASHQRLSEMQNLSPHPRLNESESVF